MNRLALVGAAVAVLICAAVALAADPSPSPSPYASPAASPMASAVSSPGASTTPTTTPSPSPTTGTSGSGSSTQSTTTTPVTWTADVNPVNIQGTATLTKNSDGTGTLVLQLTGMVNSQNWTVDVEPGFIQHPNNSNTIAFKSGSDVTRVAPDKIQVTLKNSEMKDFEHALASNPGGVTVFVSDGHRLSAANIPANAQ
jgi:hypothetical protein